MSEVKRIQDNEFAVSPGGIHIGHTNAEVDYILEVIENNEVNAFVEVGVHVGGLTDTLLPKVPHYLGIEIDQSIIAPTVKSQVQFNPNATFFIADAWSPQTVLETLKWGRNKGTVFIYCDGGDKTLELGLYAEITMPGDLIGVHDYGDYEGSEIDPIYADSLMEEMGFAEYKPAFKPEIVRIATWRK